MVDFSTYRALSFDCYGTLIDWESGIRAWVDGWIAKTGVETTADAFLRAFNRHESAVQAAEPSERYPLILAEVARRFARDAGLTVSDEDAEAFGASVGDWPAFEDSTSALRRLRERFELIILSNVDRLSFARSNEQLGVTFNSVITAEDVGSYKPDPQNFDTLLATADAIGVPKHQLLHVGESLFHDIQPANRDGIDVVWINRGGVRDTPRASGGTDSAQLGKPVATFTSMSDFADAALAS
ncbi:MAG: HAD-IA family hydrolase [Pseudomonadota bacterium]